MKRESCLAKLRDSRSVDVLVIGGGATGIGVAVDAASRGYRVGLLEQHDFGKGTSSRSTKLVHGGVRYLQQGNISLVMEALRERGRLRHNAPHLVHDLSFVVPNYAWWEGPFYGIGLRVYDLLAGRYGFGASRNLSRDEVLEVIPTLETEGLRGGVLYHDGQFDDARLLIALARTAEEHGAALVNHCEVIGLLRDGHDIVNGVIARDRERGDEFTLQAGCVVNATGAFADRVRQLDDPHAERLIAPSQGIHLVFDRSFLPGNTAIMVPRTTDGRVLFAIPWHGRALVGTTDTRIERASIEPRAQEGEIEFVLSTAARYLARDPSRADVLAVFAGVRPLVAHGEGATTASLSRDHSIQVSRSGLLTIVGGKWTTYRQMAQDVVDHAAMLGHLPERPCVTQELRLHGWHEHPDRLGDSGDWGSDAAAIEAMARDDAALAEAFHPRLPYRLAHAVFGARYEMARTLEDVLARRTRALLLDARAASECAERVARVLATELGRDSTWAREQTSVFRELASGYLP